MQPAEPVRRNLINIKSYNQMKKLMAICAASLVVMHANQDLSAMYWVGLIVFLFSVIIMANKLDKEYEY